MNLKEWNMIEVAKNSQGISPNQMNQNSVLSFYSPPEIEFRIPIYWELCVILTGLCLFLVLIIFSFKCKFWYRSLLVNWD